MKANHFECIGIPAQTSHILQVNDQQINKVFALERRKKYVNMVKAGVSLNLQTIAKTMESIVNKIQPEVVLDSVKRCGFKVLPATHG